MLSWHFLAQVLRCLPRLVSLRHSSPTSREWLAPPIPIRSRCWPWCPCPRTFRFEASPCWPGGFRFLGMFALKIVRIARIAAQILLGIGVIELMNLEKTYNSDEPWDLGWGTSRLNGMTPEQVDTMKLKELKNGRLAMIGITGMMVQTALFGKLF